MNKNIPKIKRGQEELTPEQLEYAKEFAKNRIAVQLSTISTAETEKEAEENIRMAYKVAGLDGDILKIVWYASPVYSVRASVMASVMDSVRARVMDSVMDSVRASVMDSVWDSVMDSVWDSVGASVRASVRAYYDANVLAYYGFFNEFFEPNDLRYLDRVNQLVSGYYLYEDVVYLIRKPALLTLDENGRLHNEVQKCVEYRDGWGFYAWHGTRVPEETITAPVNNITKKQILNEKNQEIKRVLVERVGYDKFLGWLKPNILDTLGDYVLMHVAEEVDGEELRLLKMKDTSTHRVYHLRVPLTVKSCAEAVAWSFEFDNPADYIPQQES